MRASVPRSDHGLSRHKWFWLSLLYLILLMISYLVCSRQPDPGPAPEGWQTVVLAESGRGAAPGRPILMRYLDSAPRASPEMPVILLIHGSPLAASRVFTGHAAALATTGRVLAPDLPGFGFTTRRIADYGFKAHADYLRQFLDHLSIPRVHLVAYSMGGGVALQLANGMPARVASLAMISAVGVQELELLGDYYLNRGLHALQLMVLNLLQAATPHMGLLDRQPFNRYYARNFFDADQRPLRGIMQVLSMPVMIWHGQDDWFVPTTAAREHHRLLPQSALKLYPGGHLLVFDRPQRVVADIRDFIRQVEQGRAPRREDARPERIAAAGRPFAAVDQPPASGLRLWVYLFLIALATWVSEDLACIGAGMLAARGIIGFGPAVGASFLGLVSGDMLLFMAGKHLGRPILGKAPFRWLISEAAVNRSTRWFEARGPIIILASRFAPGSRLPTYFGAGLLGCPLGIFTLYFVVACLVWTPLLVGLSALVGSRIMAYFALYQQYALGMMIAAAVILMLAARILPALFTFRGRRLFISAWRRRTRWEFWPTPLFYVPVVLYIIWLGLRYRRPTLFTAVNPGIYAGGVTGESKLAILEHLHPSGAVAPFIRISHQRPLSERVAAVRRFMAAVKTDYPLVLKPDVGHRGQGVSLIRSERAVETYLAAARGDTIGQAYVEGLEYGVFYYRFPGEQQGHILSITAKQRLYLTGDGRHTLEELILHDDRAVCLAPMHFEVHQENLADVPPAGMVVPVGNR